MNIPFGSPDVGRQELDEIRGILESGWLTNGPKTKEFEKKIASISHADGCVCFDSCTGALVTTLRMLGIGPGDEVITTPYTYTATAAVINHVGAKIVFCDLAPDSFEMDYDKLADLITERTKAVIPVDIGGKMCDYRRLFHAIDSRRHLFKANTPVQEAFNRPVVVADAAHSFSASKKIDGESVMSGELADFTCFSFHVLKVITTGGEGGAVVWKQIPGIDTSSIWYTLKLLGDNGQTLRNTKSSGNKWEYDIQYLGHNHIMTDIDAAMGMVQLDRLEALAGKRAIITYLYDQAFFGKVERMIEHLPADESYQSSMHLYPVRIPGGEERRNAVFERMYQLGVCCNVHYKPLPMFTAYKRLGFLMEDYPEAYRRFSEELTLPYHSKLTRMQIEIITKSLLQAVEKE